MSSENPEQESQEQIDQDFPDDFEIEENEDGSATLLPKEDSEPTDDQEFYSNLAKIIDPATLESLAIEYIELVEKDQKAREERDKQYANALRRSGLGDDAPGGAEFEGANRVVHPMISEAAIDFAAVAIKELFPSDGPVKTKIQGKLTPEKYQKADRKQRHMNWQTTKQIPEFRPSLEQILTQLPMGGVQYSKLYFCKRSRRPKFEFVPMDDIFVPFHAASFYSTNRRTHRQRLTRHEYEDRVASGLYIDVEFVPDDQNVETSKSEEANEKIEGKKNPQYDEDGLRSVYEIYCYLEIEEDSLVNSEYRYAPYIMTIDVPEQKIISIYRNWEPEDSTQQSMDWIIEWQFIPWRGAYAIGLDQLIGGLSAAATGALRALLDSAHINNAPTAIKLKGGQFSGQSENISVTQIHQIDAAPGIDDIRKIAMPLPFNPPSPVLFQLLGFLSDAAKGMVRTAIESNPEYSPNIAPGTQFSQVEQGLKVYSAIHARLHESMRRVLGVLHRLNKMYMDDSQHPDDNSAHKTDMSDEIDNTLAFKSDYEGEMDVEPVSDPNIFSESQRFSQMGGVGQLIQQAPQLYNIRAYHKRMLQMMKVPGIDELLPEPKGAEDENPATENIKMATGVPANALPDQEHLAHIQTHMDFFQSPMFGQNPAIKPVMASNWLNHMIQHMLMLYGSEIKDLIEKASKLPAKEFTSDDPEVKAALSKAVAAASPLALQQAEGLLEKIIPAIQETMQYVQSMQPPQPVDPSAGALQIAQIQAQTKQAELQHQKETKVMELQAQAQSDQLKAQTSIQTKDTDSQVKLTTEQQQIASDQAIENVKSQTELEKNREDNETALKITALRIATGEKAGNFKNGNSLDDPSYQEGGIVKPKTEE